MPVDPSGTGWSLPQPPPYDDLPPWQLNGEHPRRRLWRAQAGWDAAAADPRHYALLIRDLFAAGDRPPAEQLDWFRLGVAVYRRGEPRPAMHAGSP